MKIHWKAAPPPLVPEEDDDITTPVYVPRGTIDTIGFDTGCNNHHRVTHARDTIHVHASAAGVQIQLDDGSGYGYEFPMPCDRATIHLRRKGQKEYILTLDIVSAQFGSTLDIRFNREWYALPPGYYEGRLRFQSGDRFNEGGWILFHKDRPPAARTVGASQIRRRPKASPRREGVGHTIEQEAAIPDLDCGDGDDCGGCNAD